MTEPRATVRINVDTTGLARSLRKFGMALDYHLNRRKRERQIRKRYDAMVQRKLRSPRHGPGWCE